MSKEAKLSERDLLRKKLLKQVGPGNAETLLACMDDCARFLTMKEWEHKSPSWYKIADENGWTQQCKVYRRIAWTGRIKSLCVANAQNCESRLEWREKFPETYKFAKEKRAIRDMSPQMSGRDIPVWTEKMCIRDAKKYTSRSQWREFSAGAFNAAKRYGIFEKCTEHMPQRKSSEWSFATCLKKAMAAGTEKEWQKMSPRSYAVAKRKRWVLNILEILRDSKRPSSSRSNQSV